jgi:hypothetical protein
MVRLKSGTLSRHVSFDAFTLGQTESLNETGEVEPLLNRIKQRRKAGEGTGWVDIGSHLLELASSEDRFEAEKGLRPRILACLSREKILGEEVFILDIRRESRAAEESPVLGEAKVIQKSIGKAKVTNTAKSGTVTKLLQRLLNAEETEQQYDLCH